MTNLTQIDLTRQEMLSLWLKRNGKTQAEIAEATDVSEITVSRWIRAENIPSKRHEQLVSLGIPVELLPEPMDITPGPKRSAK